MNAPLRLQVDVVSDVVCPWCFLGKRRLARALGLIPEIAVDVAWRPYQLAPEIPPEGMAREAYLTAKFGPDRARLKAMSQPLVEMGRAEGILFAFDRIEKSPNTLDAHRLIRWARSAGGQDGMVERLFAAYFLEGEDIGAQPILTRLAGEAGLDAALVADLLARDADRDLVQREIALARQMGVTGVPTFLIAGRFALVGAQDSETIAATLRRAATILAREGAAGTA